MWIFIILVIPGVLAQDIVFLEIESTTPMDQDTTAREQKEVHCPSNMLFDSTENECECVPETVYYPPTDSCFNSFEQGPCKPGHYLAVPKDADIAQCIVNACGNNGTVPYKNACYSLLTTDPCESPEVLRISEDALELKCRALDLSQQSSSVPIINLSTRLSSPDKPLRRLCSPGTRRIARGKCRRII